MTDTRGRAHSAVVVLQGVAILLAVAWLWVMIRQQQHGGYFGPSADSEVDTSFAERIDIALQSIVVLAYAAMVGGIAQIVALLTRRSDD